MGDEQNFLEESRLYTYNLWLAGGSQPDTGHHRLQRRVREGQFSHPKISLLSARKPFWGSPWVIHPPQLIGFIS